jgi:hypothetical protein
LPNLKLPNLFVVESHRLNSISPISPQEELEAFLRRINVLTVAAAHALLKRYDFSPIKTLVAVGSEGAGIALTMTKACPHMQATAIDLPLATPIAQNIVEEEGATDRVKVIAVDVLSGPFSIWLCDPELCARTNEFCGYVRRECLVTQRQVELAILVTASHGSVGYPWWAHRLPDGASPPLDD